MRLAGLVAIIVLLFSATVFAQAPRCTAIDPDTGKVGTTVNVTGENLGKGSISAVYLSDANSDFKAELVSQAPDKVTIKVPQVKPGPYNISIQVKSEIFIQPVRFTVEE